MPVIVAHFTPWGAGRVLAAVHAPLDLRRLAEDAGFDEGTDVEADAVVEVGVPADGLLFEWLPPDEDVVGGFAFEDELEFVLELEGGEVEGVAAALAGLHVAFAIGNPVAEVGVDEAGERGLVEPVVVHKSGKTALLAVPDVPEERALVEELAMLLEEPVAQPVVDRLAAVAPFLQQVIEHGGLPFVAISGGEKLLEAFGRGAFAAQGREADDAVLVGEGFQPVRPESRAVREFRAGLARPAVAEQPGDGDLQRVVRAARLAVEKPLRRVVRMRLRQAVRVSFGGDSLPVGEVEGDFSKRCVCYV